MPRSFYTFENSTVLLLCKRSRIIWGKVESDMRKVEFENFQPECLRIYKSTNKKKSQKLSTFESGKHGTESIHPSCILISVESMKYLTLLEIRAYNLPKSACNWSMLCLPIYLFSNYKIHGSTVHRLQWLQKNNDMRFASLQEPEDKRLSHFPLRCAQFLTPLGTVSL